MQFSGHTYSPPYSITLHHIPSYLFSSSTSHLICASFLTPPVPFPSKPYCTSKRTPHLWACSILALRTLIGENRHAVHVRWGEREKLAGEQATFPTFPALESRWIACAFASLDLGVKILRDVLMGFVWVGGDGVGGSGGDWVLEVGALIGICGS